jgi:ribosomal protein L29
MDKLKKKDIMQKSEGELTKLLSESKVTLRGMRFGTAGSKGKDVKEQRNLRKNIARAFTALRMKNVSK